MKKILKIAGVFLLAIIIIAIGSYALIQSDWAKRKVADLVESNVNVQIEGNLKIGEITGNLLKHFSIHNSILTLKEDTLIEVNELNLKYDIWALFNRKIVLNEVALNGLNAKLIQLPDSSFNWMHIIDFAGDSLVSSDTASSSFSILFQQVCVENIEITSKLNDDVTYLPEFVSVNLCLSGIYQNDKLNFSIQSLTANTKNPALFIEHFSGEMEYYNDLFTWNEFVLKTSGSQLSSNGIYDLDNLMKLQANINSECLNFNEISPFIGDYEFGGSPSFTVLVDGDGVSLKIEANIKENEQEAFLDVNVKGFEASDSLYVFCELKNINGETWMLDSSYHSMLSGKFQALGYGYSIDDSRWKIKAEFIDFEVGKWGAKNAYLDFEKSDDKLMASFQLNSRFGNIQSNIEANDLLGEAAYKFNAKLSNVDVSKFTLNPAHATHLNLELKGDGQGIDLNLARLNLNINMNEFEWGAYQVRNIQVQTQKQSNQLIGKLSLQSAYGQFHTNFELDSLFTKPGGKLSGEILNFNLGSLLKNDTLRSDIHLRWDGRFRGNDLSNLFLLANLSSANSTFMDQGIDDFHSTISYTKGIYNIEGFDLISPYFQFLAKGSGDVSNHNDLSFQVKLKNVDPLFRHFMNENAQISGEAQGRLTGNIDSLFVEIGTNNLFVTYDSMWVNNLSFSTAITLLKEKYDGTFELQTGDFGYENYALNGMNAKGSFSNSHYHASLNASIDNSNNGSFVVDVTPDSIPRIDFSSMLFKIQDKNWESNYDTTSLWLKEDAFILSEFSVFNESQRVKVGGQFSFEGEEDIMLQVADFNLKTLPIENYSTIPIEGIINSTFKVTGLANRPVIIGSIVVDKLMFDTISIDKLAFETKYSDAELSVFGNLIKNKKTLFDSEINLPLNISFTDSIVLPSLQTPISGSINCNAFDLSVFNPFLVPMGWNVEGILQSQLILSNTLERLDVSGPILLSNGNIFNKEYGIKYRNVELAARFDKRFLKLTNFSADAGKGSMKINGLVGLAPGFDLNIDTIDATLYGQKFKVLNSREMEATIDADLTMQGNQDTPTFNGKVKVIRSRINTDAILEKYGIASEDLNPPLLIQALSDTVDSQIVSSQERLTRNRREKDKTQLFLEHLKGECEIDIPRNTWITGKDMNFELAGDLKIIKTGIDFELFGDLNVRRGYYKVYGKKFVFEKGEVIFSGGSKWDPIIDFEIIYRFRSADGELKELKLNLTGKTSEPEIAFLLEDIAIEEKEAMSYLLLGRSISELSSGQQSGIERDAASMAKDLAIGQLSSLLQNKLQSSIPLDVIEISGDNQWGTGGVTIGKYLTNNLYLEYQRNFVYDKQSRVIDPEKFSLEYKLFRSWFIQATNQRSNSGFDLFFKRTWK